MQLKPLGLQLVIETGLELNGVAYLKDLSSGTVDHFSAGF